MVGGHGDLAQLVLRHAGQVRVGVIPGHLQAEDGLVTKHQGLQPLRLPPVNIFSVLKGLFGVYFFSPGSVNDEAERWPGVAAL